MLGVIPGKESLAKGSGVLYAAESLRIIRAVFEDFKLSFRIGIVITRMGPTLCANNDETPTPVKLL
jgi:hypothetical protein